MTPTDLGRKLNTGIDFRGHHCTMFGLPTHVVAVLSLLILVNVSSVTSTSNDGDCPCRDYMYERPELWKKAETARWMVHRIDWGVLSTVSARNGSGGAPFGNIYSFVDGSCTNATGTPYFYGTYMDQSYQDMRLNPTASLALTEASVVSSCTTGAADANLIQACTIRSSSGTASGNPSGNAVHVGGDPENPVCARLTLTGTLQVVEDPAEFASIQAALFQRHPQMQQWPIDHHWTIVKLVVQDVWLIDYFGGATVLTPEQYYGVTLPTRDANDNW